MSLMRGIKDELDSNWNGFQDCQDLVRWLRPRLGNDEFFNAARKEMLARLAVPNNKCPLCDLHNVLYSKVWEGTVGAAMLHMCDYFMRTGELYYPNHQLPSKLLSHRGYNILRYFFHALQRPKEAKRPSWLPTVSGLCFVLHDQATSPYATFVTRETVLGASSVSEETREEYIKLGGSQRIPDNLNVTFRKVLDMKGYQADLFWSSDLTDLDVFGILLGDSKKALKLKYDKKRWMNFWYDHLMLNGGWERLKDMESQQLAWKKSIDLFERERFNSLNWREKNMDAWRSRAAEAKRIIFERGKDENQ